MLTPDNHIRPPLFGTCFVLSTPRKVCLTGAFARMQYSTHWHGRAKESQVNRKWVDYKSTEADVVSPVVLDPAPRCVC